MTAKVAYRQQFDDIVGCWIEKMRTSGIEINQLYVAGVIDGIYLTFLACNLKHMKVLDEVRDELHKQHCPNVKRELSDKFPQRN